MKVEEALISQAPSPELQRAAADEIARLKAALAEAIAERDVARTVHDDIGRLRDELALCGQLKREYQERGAGAAEEAAKMRAALEEILRGSDHTGVWHDVAGNECDKEAEGAEFREFTPEEQTAWLDSVVGIVRSALGVSV